MPSVLDRRAPLDHHSQFDLEHQRTIADIHAAWLAHALTTGPSDRVSAEAAVAQLYRLADRPEPEFVWVSSPPAGADLIIADGLASSVPIVHGMRQSAHSDVAAVITRSKRRMWAQIDPHRRRFRWWQATLPPPDPNPGPRERARREIRDSLHTSISDGVATAIRSLTPPIAGYVTWYGQHEAPWIAHCVAGRSWVWPGMRRKTSRSWTSIVRWRERRDGGGHSTTSASWLNGPQSCTPNPPRMHGSANVDFITKLNQRSNSPIGKHFTCTMALSFPNG